MFTKDNDLWDECFKDFDEDTYCGLTVSELMDIYIEWLQTVIVDDNGPCEYCDGEKYCSTKRLVDIYDFFNPSRSVTLDITKEGLLVRLPAGDEECTVVKIGYCPKCGRKL